MVAVVVELTFSEPVDLERIVGMEVGARWCFDIYESRALVHSLSTDGTRSLCVFDAPDAEAMRRATARLGASVPPVVWAATAHPAAGAGDDLALRPGEAVLAIVDRNLAEPLSFDALQATEDARASCLAMNGVRALRSYLSLDRRRIACLYAAPDLEAVRTASRMTGLPFEDVLAARAHGA